MAPLYTAPLLPGQLRGARNSLVLFMIYFS
jgi:hypothetical protein